MKKGYKVSIAAVVFLLLLAVPITLQVLEKTNSKSMYFVENETMEFTSTTKYALSPTIKGEIKSIKITGKVIGSGEAKVMLGNKVIFDKNLEDNEIITITGNVVEGENETETNITEINETETNVTIVNETEVNITEVNETETNVTIVNETEVNITEVNETETNVTIVNETETTTTDETSTTDDSEDETLDETESTNTTETNTTEVNETETIILEQETPITIETPVIQEQAPEGRSNNVDESIQKEFTKQCKDTCKIKDFTISDEYILEITIENSRLIIYEIEYEIAPRK